jgi:hypothetical protein
LKISDTRISKRKVIYIIAIAAVITLTTIILIYLRLAFLGTYMGGGGGGTGG